MIRHHPPFEMIVDYATGVSGEGVALAVATHAALCPMCRAQIADVEAVGGALLEEIEPAPISDGLLASIMDRLDDELPADARKPRPDRETARLIPSPLLRYVESSLADQPWRSVGRMFHEVRLPLSGKNVKASLMKLRPGSLMPRHTHRGHEVTVVLAGGYRDGDQQYARGDFSAKDSADMHQPIVDEDGECLCLVILDAPLRLTGAVGRLVNPFLRI